MRQLRAYSKISEVEVKWLSSSCLLGRVVRDGSALASINASVLNSRTAGQDAGEEINEWMVSFLNNLVAIMIKLMFIPKFFLLTKVKYLSFFVFAIMVY